MFSDYIISQQPQQLGIFLIIIFTCQKMQSYRGEVACSDFAQLTSDRAGAQTQPHVSLVTELAAALPGISSGAIMSI